MITGPYGSLTPASGCTNDGLAADGVGSILLGDDVVALEPDFGCRVPAVPSVGGPVVGDKGRGCGDRILLGVVCCCFELDGVVVLPG
jgi:hypothetical protein